MKYGGLASGHTRSIASHNSAVVIVLGLCDASLADGHFCTDASSTRSNVKWSGEVWKTVGPRCLHGGHPPSVSRLR